MIIPELYLDLFGALVSEPTEEVMERRIVVSDGRGNGLYAGEVCGVGTCCRPPNHEGRHDQFDGPQSTDSVPLHPVPKGSE